MVKHVCNVCGKEFDEWDEINQFSINEAPGYGSKHDGDIVQIDLCCACFDKLVDELAAKCVHDPIISL